MSNVLVFGKIFDKYILPARKFDVSEYSIVVPRTFLEKLYINGKLKNKKGGKHLAVNLVVVHFSNVVKFPAIYLSLIRITLPKEYEKFHVKCEDDVIKSVIRGITHETIHIVIRNLVDTITSSLYDTIALKFEEV